MNTLRFFSCAFITFFLCTESKAQDPFMLYPNGNTQEFFKYVTKDYNVSGTIYHTGMLNLSGYKKITSGTTGIFYNTVAPVQKLQLVGGNILLCRSIDSPTFPGINPTSTNGAILFGDNIQTGIGFINGKWGIEYDDQYSTGGLNFFKPKSSLTATRKNHCLFIRNDGFVGINTGTPSTMLHVVGEATVSALANSGDKIVTTDATGKLMLVDKSFAGDNMGNCVAGFNIKLGSKYISNNGSSGGLSIDINNDVGVWSDIFVNGNVGVGGMIVGSPFIESSHKLQLKGSALEDAAYMELGDGSTEDWRSIKFLIKGNKADYQYYVDGRQVFGFNGKIMSVGNESLEMNLRVNGRIDAKEVKVSLERWQDVVFDKDYYLLPLDELSSFIKLNKHLPDIPSEKEVLENGINVGEMNALLLKKIEELTLYIIDQQKQIDELKIYLKK